MSAQIDLLVALTTRNAGAEFELKYANKVVETKKGRSKAEKEEIANALEGRLPITKVKKGNSKGRLVNYENAVNGQRLMEGKEDNFTSKKASGKSKIGDSNIYKSDDGTKYYIGYEPLPSDVKTLFYDAKGVELTEEEMQKFLTSADLKKEDAGSGRQEVDEAVKYVTVNIESLELIEIAGKTIAL